MFDNEQFEDVVDLNETEDNDDEEVCSLFCQTFDLQKKSAAPDKKFDADDFVPVRGGDKIELIKAKSLESYRDWQQQQSPRTVPSNSVLKDRIINNAAQHERSITDFSDTSGPVNKIPERPGNVCTGFKGPELPHRQVEFPSNELKEQKDRVIPNEKNEREALAIEAKNIAAFKESWHQSVKDLGLDKTAVGPLMNEIGEQLAAGKLDVEKLQKLMKGVSLPEEDLRKVSRLIRAFNEDLSEEYGLYLNLSFKGGKDGVTVDSISVAEAGGAHQFNTSIKIASTGETTFQSKFTAGYAGPIVGELSKEQAMTKLRAHVVNGTRNILP